MSLAWPWDGWWLRVFINARAQWPVCSCSWCGGCVICVVCSLARSPCCSVWYRSPQRISSLPIAVSRRKPDGLSWVDDRSFCWCCRTVERTAGETCFPASWRSVYVMKRPFKIHTLGNSQIRLYRYCSCSIEEQSWNCLYIVVAMDGELHALCDLSLKEE